MLDVDAKLFEFFLLLVSGTGFVVVRAFVAWLLVASCLLLVVCHPALLARILEAGLADYVAMDIKNSPEKYARTAGLARLDLGPIRESVGLLMAGNADYEFRTTVVDELHEAADFEAIGAWIAGAKHYFLQAFTDRDSVPFGNLHAPSADRLLEYAQIARCHVADTQLRGVDL